MNSSASKQRAFECSLGTWQHASVNGTQLSFAGLCNLGDDVDKCSRVGHGMSSNDASLEGVTEREGALQAKSEDMGCGRNLACVPMSKGVLANAKFGYCAGGTEAQAALGSAAAPSSTQPQCGPVCIAGAAIAGAMLAALVVSAAWWFNVRRTQAK